MDMMPHWNYIPTSRADLEQQVFPWCQVDEVVIEKPLVAEDMEEHVVSLQAADPEVVNKMKISLEEYRRRGIAPDNEEVDNDVDDLCFQSHGRNICP